MNCPPAPPPPQCSGSLPVPEFLKNNDWGSRASQETYGFQPFHHSLFSSNNNN